MYTVTVVGSVSVVVSETVVHSVVDVDAVETAIESVMETIVDSVVEVVVDANRSVIVGKPESVNKVGDSVIVLVTVSVVVVW